MRTVRFLLIFLVLLGTQSVNAQEANPCNSEITNEAHIVARKGDQAIIFAPKNSAIGVNNAVSLEIFLCNLPASSKITNIDAIMPMHQHGMNYTPQIVKLSESHFVAEPFIFHMPGNWQLLAILNTNGDVIEFKKDFLVRP